MLIMNSVISGTKAKKDGHKYEEECVHLLNKRFGGDHKTDGRPQTKVDVYDNEGTNKYSVKNVSKNHTQVALLSSKKFIDYFGISDSHCEYFIKMFFGYPNKNLVSIVESIHPYLNLSDAEKRQNRVYRNNISDDIVESFLSFMNSYKMEIFDIIVKRGFSGDSINHIVWRNKITNNVDIINVDSLVSLVENGTWKINNTTLEFRTSDNFKLFHLQMKGSGKKYNSGYHGMMFHMYWR